MAPQFGVTPAAWIPCLLRRFRGRSFPSDAAWPSSSYKHVVTEASEHAKAQTADAARQSGRKVKLTQETMRFGAILPVLSGLVGEIFGRYHGETTTRTSGVTGVTQQSPNKQAQLSSAVPGSASAASCIPANIDRVPKRLIAAASTRGIDKDKRAKPPSLGRSSACLPRASVRRESGDRSRLSPTEGSSCLSSLASRSFPSEGPSGSSTSLRPERVNNSPKYRVARHKMKMREKREAPTRLRRGLPEYIASTSLSQLILTA